MPYSEEQSQAFDPSSAQVLDAKSLLEQMTAEDADNSRFVIETAGGQRLVLSEDLSEIMFSVFRLTANGESFEVAPIDEDLSSVQAAQVLGVSRPTILKLAVEGVLPSHKVGTHTRFFRRDLNSYQHKQREERFDAYYELREFEDIHGLYDD